MNRFEVVRYEKGILLVDLVTGEVRRIPFDGLPSEVLPSQVLPSDTRPGTIAAPAAEVSSSGTLASPVPFDAPAENPSGTTDVSPWLEPGDDLGRDVLAAYPYPIASAWSRFLGEQDARVQRWALVDVFVCALKTWSFFAVSLYLRSGLRDEKADELIVQGMRRPLLSVWSLALDQILPLLRDHGGLSFAPEAETAWRALSREKVVLAQSRSKVSPVLALLSFRNEMAHGLQSDMARARDDVRAMEPQVRRLLEAQRFLTRYGLHRAAGFDGSMLKTERWVGARPPILSRPMPNTDPDVALGQYFLRSSADESVLPLLELVTSPPSASDAETASALPPMGLFEGYGKRACVYVSLGGERWESETPRERWGRRIRDRSSGPPRVALTSTTVDGLREAAGRTTRAALRSLESSGVTVPEAYVPRPFLDAAVDRLEHGEFRAMVVAGDLGSGKTSWLADLARRRLDEGHLVLFYRGSTLVHADVNSRIVRDLGLREEQLYVEDVLFHLDPRLPTESFFYVLVDGVDQSPAGAKELIEHLDALVAQIAPFRSVKVVATVREGAYRRLPRGSRFGARAEGRYLVPDTARSESVRPSECFHLALFEPSEVREAYEKSRAAAEAIRVRPGGEEGVGAPRVATFRPLTGFDELRPEGSTVALMREPLLLRLILEAYDGRRVRSDLSVAEVMDVFVRKVVLPDDDPFVAAPRRAFLTALARLFDEAGKDAVALEALYDRADLRAAALNPERESPFVQLLELGVLQEVLDGEAASIRFTTNRLLTYFLLQQYDKAVDTFGGLVHLARRSLAFPALRDVLAEMLAKTVRDEREPWVVELVAHVAASERTEPTLVELVSEALATLFSQLAQLDGRALPPLLEGFVEHPAAAARDAMVRAADVAIARGDLAGAEMLADAALSVAGRLDDEDGIARAYLVRSRLRLHRDQRDAALSDAMEARRHVPSDDTDTGMTAVQLVIRLLVERNDLDEAARLLEGRAERAEARSEWRDAAELLLLEGRVAFGRGDTPHRLVCDARALELAQRADDPSLVSRASNNLALVYKALGRKEEAAHHFDVALAAKRKLGDTKSLATSLLNAGAFHLDLGDGPERAAQLFREAEAGFRRIGYAVGIQYARTNRALAEHYAAGEYGAAIRIFDEVLAMEPAPELASAIHGFRSMAALDVGLVAEARSSRAAIEHLGTQSGKTWLASIDLALEALEGDVSSLPSCLAEVAARFPDQGTEGMALFSLPITAWLEAANRLEREGRSSEAEAVRAKARAALGTRAHPRRDELSSVRTPL